LPNSFDRSRLYQTDTERRQDYAEAVRTHEQMVRVYEECGYKPFELPLATSDGRAEFILSTLSTVE
jgi:predicted ATPase